MGTKIVKVFLCNQIFQRNWWFLATSFLMILVLSGCVDIAQEIWILSDGGGRCSLQIAVPEGVVKLSGKDQLAEVVQQAKEIHRDDLKIVTASDSLQGGIHYYTIDYETSDIKNCLWQTSDQKLTMQLASQKNGRTSFIQTMYIGESMTTTLLRSAMEGSSIFPEFTPLSQLLQSSMFKDHYWSVHVHTPGAVVRTNGKYDKTTNMTSWRIPLSDIIGKDAKPVSLELKYLPPGERLSLEDYLDGAKIPSSFLVGFLAGGVTFGVVSLLILRAKKR